MSDTDKLERARRAWRDHIDWCPKCTDSNGYVRESLCEAGREIEDRLDGACRGLGLGGVR